MSWLDDISYDSTGLVPVIAQDALTGEPLMLAYANREALQRTRETGRGHYWSRSRQELWEKGATSGHVQEVAEIRLDCDGDAVIYRVHQSGPACHTLERSCFHRVLEEDAFRSAAAAGHVLARVEDVIADRAANPREGAYTNYLIEEGLDKVLKKIGEESVEVVVAAKNSDDEELAGEVADLMFHLLVMMRVRNLDLRSVWKELDARFGRAPRPRNSNGRKVEE